MEHFKEHWARVRSRLLDLRHLFESNPGGSVSVEYFDESLEANELEVALHALCDRILAASPIRLTAAEIEEIAMLHAQMALTDECVSMIRRKLG